MKTIKINGETGKNGIQEEIYNEGRKAGNIFLAKKNADVLCRAWILI